MILYAKLDSILDQCLPWDSFIVLDDFNVTTGTKRAGYDLIVGPLGSGAKNTKYSLRLNFLSFNRLKTAGFCYQRSKLLRWKWYSMLERYLRSTISSQPPDGGSYKTAGFFVVQSFLEIIIARIR